MKLSIMDPYTYLFVIIFLITTLAVLFRYKNFNYKQVNMLNSLPGPRWYPFVGTTGEFLFMQRQDVFNYFRNLAKTYKSIFRYWVGSRPTVFLTEPKYVEVLLSSTVHINKGKNYDFSHPWLGEGLLTSTGSKWFRDRKLLTPAFHFKILETVTDVFVEKSEKFVEILSHKANGKEFDIFPYITRFALDVMSKSAMGLELNSMTNEKNEYLSAVCGACEAVIRRITRPWLGPNFIFYRTNHGKQFLKHLSVLNNTVNNVIDEKRASLREKSSGNSPFIDALGQKKRKAFLDLLLDIEDGSLSKKELLDQVNTFMFAGHDTTSSAICWALFLLALHQEIQDKCYEEITNVLSPEKNITYASLNDLKYLERVIKECQRLFPSVGNIARNISDDMKIGNYTIPKGCNVHILINDLHMDPQYFPEPHKFDPDRFLPENSKDRHPYAYIPFSAGPRNCIGQKYALMKEKTVLIHILRSFKIRTTQTMEDIDPALEIILRPRNGLLVTLEKRLI